MSHFSSRVIALVCVACAGALVAFKPSHAPASAKIQLDIGTLHAATLSEARSKSDSTDAPYLMVTLFGPGASHASMQMPSGSAHWTIRRDEAKPALPLTSLSIAPGDSVRVLLTLLEGDKVNASEELTVSSALAKLKMPSSAEMKAPTLAPALAPLTQTGSHWLGSATMLLTNEGGKTYWRALDCVSTCKISNAPAETPAASELTQSAKEPLGGVVELSGNGAVYHMKLTARRSM